MFDILKGFQLNGGKVNVWFLYSFVSLISNNKNVIVSKAFPRSTIREMIHDRCVKAYLCSVVDQSHKTK